ncbi:hypothetical protein KYY02_25180 [Streptomyces pimonensis]|uniref:Uncharacterized protein n=1 Tax=Streptomyces pimonensis TaxID=2860288 RepID=A0ABV4J4K2_9ACTN
MVAHPPSSRAAHRISQPHFALPAVLTAAEPAPLQAVLDAVRHAVNTYGEHYPELLEKTRSVCAGKAGEWAGLPRGRRPG